jgi:hypothetical protein
MESDAISQIVFLFVAWAIITSGSATQILSCQVQLFFQNSFVGKHIIGFVLILMFIMMEGGWAFDKEDQDKAPVDWSNGNIFDTSVYALGLYFIFLFSAKMKLVPNLLFFSLLFLIYLLNTQQRYWKNRKTYDKRFLDAMEYVVNILLFASIFVFLYGINDYRQYKLKEYGNKFNYTTFILGNVNNCKSIKK